MEDPRTMRGWIFAAELPAENKAAGAAATGPTLLSAQRAVILHVRVSIVHAVAVPPSGPTPLASEIGNLREEEGSVIPIPYRAIPDR